VCVCIYIYIIYANTHTHTHKTEQVSVVAALKTCIFHYLNQISAAILLTPRENFSSCPANIKQESWCNTSFHVTDAPSRSSFWAFTRNFPHRSTKYTRNPNRWQSVHVITTQAINLTPCRLKTEKFPVRLAFHSTTQFSRGFLLFSECRNYQRIS